MIKITLAEFLKIPVNCFKGKIICFPTDTVYGVGAMINDESAISKIYTMKHRPVNKPLAVLACDAETILPYVDITNDLTCELMSYWPGALTIIFKKKPEHYNLLSTTLPTIGFRIPNSIIALTILRRLGPLATTSVNISSETPLNCVEDIEGHFSEDIDYLVTDTEQLSNCSSTVVDATTSVLKVIRQGDIIIKNV